MKVPITQDLIRFWLNKIELEYKEARERFGPFNSGHEGYAVIKEELDELWDNIKEDSPIEFQRAEAVQVAAMCLAFILEVNYDWKDNEK